jgi:photosystem II stability/assembly factor-like uncharacterized protein
MTLLIGTDDGLYRTESVPFERDEAEAVLDCGMVTMIKNPDHTDGVFISSTTGAFRSVDGGTEWEDLDVPLGSRFWHAGESQVWAIHPTADGTLYAGTNDPYLYRSVDDGETWLEMKGFRDIESYGHWESPIDPHYARLRSLENVPGRPEQLIAGIEAGGIHRSNDGGQTWIDGRDNIIDDIHQVYPITEDVWLAATGYLDHNLEAIGMGHAVGSGGLHRTVNGGESWTRIDQGNEYSYIRRVFVHDGTMMFCGGIGAPPAWANDEHEAALFESTDFGRSYERVSYPGEPHEVIETWTEYDGDVLCGSGLFDVPERRDDIEGRVMLRDGDGEYETVGRVAANIGQISPV